ncbi:uncharacterized protein LOC132664215 [Panthera onca]
MARDSRTSQITMQLLVLQFLMTQLLQVQGLQRLDHRWRCSNVKKTEDNVSCIPQTIKEKVSRDPKQLAKIIPLPFGGGRLRLRLSESYSFCCTKVEMQSRQRREKVPVPEEGKNKI